MTLALTGAAGGLFVFGPVGAVIGGAAAYAVGKAKDAKQEKLNSSVRTAVSGVFMRYGDRYIPTPFDEENEWPIAIIEDSAPATAAPPPPKKSVVLPVASAAVGFLAFGPVGGIVALLATAMMDKKQPAEAPVEPPPALEGFYRW